MLADQLYFAGHSQKILNERRFNESRNVAGIWHVVGRGKGLEKSVAA